MQQPHRRPLAYSYVRFSTPEQALGDSKRRQVEKAREYALRHELELVNDAFMDQGISAYRGLNKDKGALADFLSAVEDGAIPVGSYLLVESMDRISREKPRAAVRLLEDICEQGIVLVTLGDQKVYTAETLDSDPMSFMWAFMVAIRANEESETKSKRLREAWGKKKRDAREVGKPLTSRTPAWLKVSADGSRYEVLEERAEIIRGIFRDALAGVGQHTIASRLNGDDVEPFGDGSRKAKFWQRSYVAKLLTNAAVIGTFVPHETKAGGAKKERTALEPIPDFFPAIIKKADFKRMQDRLAGEGTTPRMRSTKGEVSNILAGLAKCPKCAGTMTRVNKGPRGGAPYLVCTTAKAGAGCAYKAVKLTLVERAVTHAARGDLVGNVPAGEDGLDLELRRLGRDQDGLNAMIGNLVEEIAKGNTSPALAKHLREYEAQLKPLEDQIEEVSAKISRGGKRAIATNLKRIEETFGTHKSPKAPTVTEANAVLRDAFSHCVVSYEEGSLVFYWKHGGATEVPYDFPV